METTWKIQKEIQNAKLLLMFLFSKLKLQDKNERFSFSLKKNAYACATMTKLVA